MTNTAHSLSVDPVSYDKTRKRLKYVVRYRDGTGRRRRRSFRYRHDAVAFRVTLLRAANFNPEALPLTLQDAISRFVDTIVGRSRYVAVETTLRVHVSPRFGQTPLHEVGPEFYQAVRDHIYGLKLCSKYTSIVRRALEHALVFAADRNWLPVPAVELPKRQPTTTHCLKSRANWSKRKIMPTLDEVNRLLKGVDDLVDTERDWLRVPVYLALRAGLRIGEILSLRWGDIDFDKAQIHVRSSEPRAGDSHRRKDSGLSPPKTRSGHRFVTMPKRLVEVLEHWRDQLVADESCKVVFRPTDCGFEPLTRKALTIQFIYLQAALGMTKLVHVDRSKASRRARFYPGHFSFHQLRHAHVAILIWGGIPNDQISASVGHKHIRTTLDMYGYLIKMHREGSASWPGGREEARKAYDTGAAHTLVVRNGRVFRVHSDVFRTPSAAEDLRDAA